MNFRRSIKLAERTKLPIRRFQPSISTKNRIFTGREITEGGSIIMPIDIVSVATIMSMTRNGNTIRNPISKPRRSSEIMKAGMRSLKSAFERSATSKRPLDRPSNRAMSFSRTWLSMNSRNGSTTAASASCWLI